ncbi:OsmC family peroxiredoxin [Sinisalibacter aestuarii]|uniref:Osmotically inducible protein OsmC n=1 Tax=Sinisalibacter aestuarii TaxID=2949426 RepID=A0ABQ5LSC3_9RHOB|nr:OsmC family peroxiredoxin [Sinisalibacter aestuarii]GKY87819.1 osmotically inducible protein OsmC [Sinisalibacter aestuarii]
MIRKYGSAVWEGTLKEGQGHLSSQSGVLKDVAYDFRERFEGAPGTNPEELIGAAHAACFSMALSNILAEQGITATRIEARSTISLDLSDGAKIVAAHLDVTFSAAGDEATLMAAAKAAETGCPVSQLLSCEITMDAKLG